MSKSVREAKWWYEMNPLPLAGKPIESVEVQDDNTLLVFRLLDGRTVCYRVSEECCSESWIEHLTVPPDIRGAEVETYDEQELGEYQKDRETIRIYQTSFGTPKGEIIVEYRNSSNGYYGGALIGPIEDWANAEITATRGVGSV